MNGFDIKFECEVCGQRLVVESSGAGLSMECPNCQQTLLVPESLPLDRAISVSGRATGRGEMPLMGEHAPESHMLHRQLAEANLLTERLERELEAFQEESHRVRTELSDREEELAAVQDERELSRALCTALAAQLSSREREAAEALAVAADLRQEVGRLRTLLARTQQEKAAAESEGEGLKAQLEGEKTLKLQIHALEGRLAESRTSLDDLTRVCAGQADEADMLKRHLQQSEDGREMLKLRDLLQVAQQEAARRGRAQRDLEKDLQKLQQREAGWSSETETLRRRSEAAEQKAEAQAESSLLKERDVLRGIVERQKIDLEQQFRQIAHFRRERFGLRLLHAAAALLVLGGLSALGFWFWGLWTAGFRF